ncbi:hypothetical protein TSUD_340260 [Trifolium subterraneum]|uniref:Uncharacterized protein n=1 Tax=Trifolium subterraneum TaxID=3900 RepID=A0A2Z6LJC1_TRISU|nr:hypothetical protein TSUD_340260 [Trifolium subterraneum]
MRQQRWPQAFVLLRSGSLRSELLSTLSLLGFQSRLTSLSFLSFKLAPLLPPIQLAVKLQIVMEATQILLNAQVVDGAVRNQAENNLNLFQEQNLPSFLSSLVGELANDKEMVLTDLRGISIYEQTLHLNPPSTKCHAMNFPLLMCTFNIASKVSMHVSVHLNESIGV